MPRSILRPPLARNAFDLVVSMGVIHHLDDPLLGMTRLGELVRWAARLWWRAFIDPERVRAELFGNQGGVCLVHGDTLTTLLSVKLARACGLRVAHVEAGLRSRSWLHPFP